MEHVCYYDHWYILFIYFLVGYGDYYPTTNIGRFIIMFTALCGIVLVSLIVYSLQNAIQLEEYEEKVYEFISRMESKAEIKKEAALYFHRTFKYFLEKKKYLRIVRDRTKPISHKQQRIMKKSLLDTLYKKLSHKRGFKMGLQ